MRPSQTADKFILRLPDGMRGRLKAEAKLNNRSMTMEIVARLTASFGEGAFSTVDDAADRLTAAITQLETLIKIASPACEIIRSAQDEAMEPVPATGQPPAGAGSHLCLFDAEDRSGEVA